METPIVVVREPGVTILEVEDLWKRYGAIQALRGVSFSLDEGEVRALLGPNGAGKSTTVKIIMGLVKPSRGSVRVLGVEATEPGGHVLRRRIGYMPETPQLPKWARVGEILEKYAALYGLPKNEISGAVRRTLDLVGLSDLRGRSVAELSKGQVQRLTLAQAVMHEPEILILDEPLLGLDPEGMELVRSIIRREAARGSAILMNTHLLKEAEDVCDNVTLLYAGRVMYSGSVEELKRHVSIAAILIVDVEGDPARAADLLRTLPYVEGVEIVGRRRLRVRLTAGEDRSSEISKTLVAAGFGIRELRHLEPSLEEAFLKLVRGGAYDLA